MDKTFKQNQHLAGTINTKWGFRDGSARNHLEFYEALELDALRELILYLFYRWSLVHLSFGSGAFVEKDFPKKLPLFYDRRQKEPVEEVDSTLRLIQETDSLSFKKRIATVINELLDTALKKKEEKIVTVIFRIQDNYFSRAIEPKQLVRIIEAKKRYYRVAFLALNQLIDSIDTWTAELPEAVIKEYLADPWWRKENGSLPNANIWALEAEFHKKNGNYFAILDVLTKIKKWPENDTMFFRDIIFAINHCQGSAKLIKQMWPRMEYQTKKGLKTMITKFCTKKPMPAYYFSLDKEDKNLLSKMGFKFK